MAWYTLSMQAIIEQLTPNMHGMPMYERCDAAIESIFDFNFPLYEESHRRELCRKILAHYLTYEIGCETYALWKFRLTERMFAVMPYFNELYKSVLNEFDDSLYDVDITIEKSGTDTDGMESATNETVGRTYTRNSNRRADDNRTITESGENTRSNSNTINENVSDVTDFTHSNTQKHTGTVSTKSTNSTENDSTNTTTSTGAQVQSDFPQASLIVNYDYASGAQSSEGTTRVEGLENITGSGSSNSTNDLTDTENAIDKTTLSGVKDTTNTGSSSENISNTTKDDFLSDVFEKTNDTDDTISDGSSKTTSTKTYGSKTRTHGFQGSKSKSELAMQFREAIINVDMMVIESLKDLFMLVFDSEVFG